MTGERSTHTTADRIVEAADTLFYRHGYEHTTFGMIAADVGISRGNFHHHFKTKDHILAAVIARRSLSTSDMLDRWAAANIEPAAQVRCFIDMLTANRSDIMRFGCPVVSLCSELAKASHPLLDSSGRILCLFRKWLGNRFTAICFEAATADELAVHLLVLSQGIAVLANLYKDDAMIDREVTEAHRWLDDQLSRRQHLHPGS